ncbi:MAG: FkbM family methyltransferase [Pseudomonadota bacterium]
MPSAALRGISRSLRTYHGNAERSARMAAMYGRFLQQGSLAFDVGAHVGDRVTCFRSLGASVVAVEPQPMPARVLRMIHGRDPHVTLVEAACGTGPGTLRLHINEANPTVSTGSTAFVRAANGARGWEGQDWNQTADVAMVSLDQLISDLGMPDFVKIDVEGFEADVLNGLSHAPPALSFEFTMIQRDVAHACLARLTELGEYRFHLSLGETHRFTTQMTETADEMSARIDTLPHTANSGDVYAVLANADTVQ